MHTIYGELRKAPFVKPGCGQDGQSTMFIVELSEMIKDYKSGEKSYTNYSAVLFAKSQAHVDHYNNSLVEGNYIVVSGDKLKVDVSESNGKQYIKLQVENARLCGSKYIQGQNNAQQQPQYQQQGQQNGYQQQAPQQAPQSQGGFQQQRPMDQAMAQNGVQGNQAPHFEDDSKIPF